tara:strand:- start:390 stop:593 length:204 start_codon:yes stop_codon:yes gene_type:complete
MDIELKKPNNELLESILDMSNTMKSDVKEIKTDLQYIKERIKLMNEQRDKNIIKEVQAKQEGWFLNL